MGTFTRFWVWQQLTEFCILNLVCHRHLLEATFEFYLAFLQPTTGILLGEEFPVLWVLYGKHCWKVQNPYFSFLCRQGQTCGLSLTNTVTLDMDYMPGTHKARPAHPALGGSIGRGALRGAEEVPQGHHWPRRWFPGSIWLQSWLFILLCFLHIPQRWFSSIPSNHLGFPVPFQRI